MSRFLIIILLSLFLSLSAEKNETPLPLKKIAITKNWKELFAQPILTLKNGTKVRLGLETDTALVDSGFLIYALVEGHDWKVPEKGEIKLGPLGIEIITELAQLEVLFPKENRNYRIRERAQFSLYVAVIPIRNGGKIQLQLFDDTDKVVALSDINTSSQDCHRWLTLSEVFTSQELPYVKLTNRASISALPKYDYQYEPFTWLDSTDFSSKQEELLPPLIPKTTSPYFKIQFNQKFLHIKINKGGIEHLPVESYFLSRWWINGKIPPRRLTHLCPQGPKRLMKLRKLSETLSLKIKLELVWRCFGAKPGDQIGLQLLYCPQKWTPNEKQRQLRKLRMLKLRKIEPDLPLLSNRIEFIAR